MFEGQICSLGRAFTTIPIFRAKIPLFTSKMGLAHFRWNGSG